MSQNYVNIWQLQDTTRDISVMTTEIHATTGTCNRVEGFTTFCDFRKWTHCCRSGIFLWVQLQKNRHILPGAQQSFYFQKIIVKLNWIFFFIGKYLLFTYKNTRKKEIEKKIILGLQNGQKKFDLDKGKIKILLNFSSFLA